MEQNLQNLVDMLQKYFTAKAEKIEERVKFIFDSLENNDFALAASHLDDIMGIAKMTPFEMSVCSEVTDLASYGEKESF